MWLDKRERRSRSTGVVVTRTSSLDMNDGRRIHFGGKGKAASRNFQIARCSIALGELRIDRNALIRSMSVTRATFKEGHRAQCREENSLHWPMSILPQRR